MKTLYAKWQNISRLWLAILMFVSTIMFFAACIWWDRTISLERNALFALAWAALNLTRKPKETQ